MTMLNIIGKAGKLVDLVNYQDDSIVSKEIIKNEKGTVTLFAFDIGGKTHLLETGEVIIMPANKPHALKAIERFKMFLVMVRS